MPISVEILKDVKLVIARAHGQMTGEDMMMYQRETWGDPEVSGFDEIVDVTAVESFAYESPNAMKKVAHLSAQMDWINESKKFAIIAKDDTAFGLGRMYQSYRDANPLSRKEVQIFKTMEQARQWLGR